MLKITELSNVEYIDGSFVPVCSNSLDGTWPVIYYVTVFIMFFVVPFLILLFLFFVMSRRLITDSKQMCSSTQYKKQIQIRKQVVIMVATVCLTFFICLFPFRLLTLWIVFSPPENIQQLGMERYNYILYFCRILIYINSAINPILYNLISSKFRKAFCNTLWLRKTTYSTKSHVVVSERISTSLIRTGHSSPILFGQVTVSPDRGNLCNMLNNDRRHSIHSLWAGTLQLALPIDGSFEKNFIRHSQSNVPYNMCCICLIYTVA